MIEKIPDQIPVQTGEWRGTTFDIIPKETFGMACRKINELVDAVNRHENIIRQIGEWGSSKNECLWCENLTEVNLNDRMIGCTTLDIPESYKELHKAPETELERTRKALDAALNCLNGVVKDLPWVKRTLDEITALEQKEHFADTSKKIEQQDK